MPCLTPVVTRFFRTYHPILSIRQALPLPRDTATLLAKQPVDACHSAGIGGTSATLAGLPLPRCRSLFLAVDCSSHRIKAR
jgi:hypothetical protein